MRHASEKLWPCVDVIRNASDNLLLDVVVEGHTIINV